MSLLPGKNNTYTDKITDKLQCSVFNFDIVYITFFIYKYIVICASRHMPLIDAHIHKYINLLSNTKADKMRFYTF